MRIVNHEWPSGRVFLLGRPQRMNRQDTLKDEHRGGVPIIVPTAHRTNVGRPVTMPPKLGMAQNHKNPNRSGVITNREAAY